MDKVRSTLKQFVRDWSREVRHVLPGSIANAFFLTIGTQGIEEREACYKPMKDALLQHFSDIPFEERSLLASSR